MQSLFGIVLGMLLASQAVAEQPNIVSIICDDLGYGDVQCLAPATSKIPTPGIDALAAEGMIFTDAHSGSSVCTPTRYGVLTGRYSWRTKLQRGVVQGFAPCLIDRDRLTVAGFLKQRGYDTAIIGKWHLNYRYLDPATGEELVKTSRKGVPPVGAVIPDGPIARGFDSFRGIHHAGSMKAVVKDARVVEHDDEINMLPRLLRESVAYLDSRAGNPAPFFLYVPLTSPHTPIVPAPEWQGRSGLGAYADFVMQTDDVVAKLMAALDKNGLAENTLVVFTSDNGCSKAAGIERLAEQGHLVSAGMRGSKADIWDGGHRVPFLVRWPDRVKAGSRCDQLICLTDLFATVAEVVGESAPAGTCEDSVSFLPALRGKPIASTRAGVVHHSISGHFAYRTGDWKLILARGSGGWTSPKEKQVAADALEAQLYNLATDPAEQTNLYRERPERAQELLARLKADIHRGRSTDGPASANDVDKIELWKSGRE